MKDDHAKAKWKYIKEKYRTTKKDAKTRSGQASKDVKKPKWPFWKTCQFLEPHTADAE